MINEVLYKTTKNGTRRAYYYSISCARWMPLSIAKADMLIATEQATEVGRVRFPTTSERAAERVGAEVEKYWNERWLGAGLGQDLI